MGNSRFVITLMEILLCCPIGFLLGVGLYNITHRDQCHHEWVEMAYRSHTDTMFDYIKYLYACSKCGKMKKVRL